MESLSRSVEQRQPEVLIFDLRFNTGGNLVVGTPLVKLVAEKFGEVPLRMPPGKTSPYDEMWEAFDTGWIDFGVYGTAPVAGTTTPAEVFAQARKA